MFVCMQVYVCTIELLFIVLSVTVRKAMRTIKLHTVADMRSFVRLSDATYPKRSEDDGQCGEMEGAHSDGMADG